MRLLLGCILCLTLLQGYSQLLDLAKAEYLYVPGSTSNFEYHRQTVELNVPFKVKDDGFFFVGLDYSRMLFRFQEAEDSYDKADAENFKSLDLNLTYTKVMKNDWRFGIQITPSFNSNLTGRLNADDLLVNGVLVFIRSKNEINGFKKNRLMLGLGYSTTSRFPGPVPFVNYYYKFHPKWSFTVGAPYSNIQFHASDKIRFKIHAEAEAFNANLQEDIIVENGEVANRLRFVLINVGFRYEYKFSEYIESYAILSRTVFSDLQLRDGKESVFQPTLNNAAFFRLGVRFKI